MNTQKKVFEVTELIDDLESTPVEFLPTEEVQKKLKQINITLEIESISYEKKDALEEFKLLFEDNLEIRMELLKNFDN